MWWTAGPLRTWLAAGDLRSNGCCPVLRITRGIYFSLDHSHIVMMVGWQKTGFTREPPKTKAELREMLTEAVRNTQTSADNEASRLPKTKKFAAD